MSGQLSSPRHLSDDELIEQIYGVGSEDTAHLDSCVDCAMRLSVFERRRIAALDAPPVPEALLASERRRILERLEQRQGFRLHWVPAAVLAGGLIAAVALVPRVTYAP